MVDSPHASSPHDATAATGSPLSTAAVDLFKGIGHAAIQNTYNGLAQLVSLSGVELPQMHVFDLSKPAGKLDAAAQVIGEGAGMVLPYLAVSKLTNMALAPADIEGASWEGLGLRQRLFSSQIVRAGISGALYQGVLMPVSQGAGGSGGWAGFLSARAESALAGGATFATIGGASQFLGERTAGLAATGSMRILKNIGIGALSGVPAGLVSAEGQSLVAQHRLAGVGQMVDSAATFAVVGGALSGVGQGVDALSARDAVRRGAAGDLLSVDSRSADARSVDSRPADSQSAANSETLVEEVPGGLLERDATTGHVLKAVTARGSYIYDWQGDELTRAATPHWTYVRDGDSSNWLTFSKNGKPHTHSYVLDVENDGTFVRHNLKTNQINREQPNGDSTVIYSPQGDAVVAQRTLHPDDSTTTLFRDGHVELRDSQGELHDSYPATDGGGPVRPSANPIAQSNDQLERLFQQAAFDPHAQSDASVSPESLPVVPVEKIDGGTIRRDSTSGRIVRTTGFRGDTSYEWNSQGDLVGFTLPSGVRFTLQNDQMVWAPTDPTGTVSERPRAYITVDSRDGALVSHNLDNNTLYRHQLNGDIVVQEPLRSGAGVQVDRQVIHPDGSSTSIFTDGTSQLIDQSGQIVQRFGPGGKPDRS